MPNFTAMFLDEHLNILRVKTTESLAQLVLWLETVGAHVEGALTARDLELMLNEEAKLGHKWVVREW